MVRGNHVLPNAHFHKWWQRYVKTWFNQPGRKKTRRLARQDKVIKNGTRPIGLLRPAVHPPTQRYNLKIRYGRGFTLEELKQAKISKKVARTIGISVDHRRKNRCEQSLNLNVKRLEDYKNRLIVFPKNPRKPKKGFAGIPDETLKSDTLQGHIGVKMEQLFPLPKVSKPMEFRAITDKEREFNAAQTLKELRQSLKKQKTKMETS